MGMVGDDFKGLEGAHKGDFRGKSLENDVSEVVFDEFDGF